MFENVKSKYILKIILSYVKEEQKLKMIKYNKKFQSIMGIYLSNYIFLSNRYIIYEKNKRGKEYRGNDDKLLYEGEFLNGRRHGKGKEYEENYIGNCLYENGKQCNKKKSYRFMGRKRI